jgi:hypothetical protein
MSLNQKYPCTACDEVCKALLTVANCVKSCQLVGLNLDKLLWEPLGRQVVGLLISHIR